MSQIKFIYGYCPVAIKRSHKLDMTILLDLHRGDYKDVLKHLESIHGGTDSFIRTYDVLLFNFMDDDYASEHVWIYDAKENALRRFKDCEWLMYKLRVMGPGEALSDSDFGWESV